MIENLKSYMWVTLYFRILLFWIQKGAWFLSLGLGWSCKVASWENNDISATGACRRREGTVRKSRAWVRWWETTLKIQGGACIKLVGVLGEKQQPQGPSVGAAPTEEKEVCAWENTALDPDVVWPASCSARILWASNHMGCLVTG